MKLFASFSSEGASVRRLLLLQVFPGVIGMDSVFGWRIARAMLRPRYGYRTEKDGEYGHTGTPTGERTPAFQKPRSLDDLFTLHRAPIGGALYLSPRRGWFTVALAMTIYLLFLGRWICGRPLGALVNERNLMSLSRFQMLAWTILLLSAFFTVALKRLHVLSANHAAVPLNIGMVWQLWALMGISATSLVGTPLLLSPKATQSPDPKSINKAASLLNEPAAAIQADSQGTLYANAKMSDASLMDMFQGDEVGDTAYVDVSKLQMFYFTVIAILAYAYALYSAMANICPQEGFPMPVPSDTLVGLLGISHAAYLTSKTTQHS